MRTGYKRTGYKRTGYKRETWEFGSSREVEEKHTGNYGARGQKRERRRKPTKEEIAKQNQWKRERDVRRLIKWNFTQNDYWMTITYKKGERPSAEEMKKDMEILIRKVRTQYRKAGKELKYICRMGIGKRGGPHMHILVNRFATEETATDLIFSRIWTKGHVNFKTTYDAGGYRDLAEYITKPLEVWEEECIKRYSRSRNLISKDPEEKIINRRSLVDPKGNMIYPKAPKGYYIDQDSIRMGINPVTGYAYRHYILIKMERRI